MKKMRSDWKKLVVKCAFLAALFVFLVAAKSPPAKAVLCQKMFIPAYFYPGSLWTQAISGAPIVNVMIMNPASGPGSSQNSDYVTAVQNARNAGIKVIGYVHTSYSQRDIDAVKGEVDLYYQWYNVSGIFFDEVNSSAAALPYYQNITNYVKQHTGAFVSLNPGTVPDQGYINISDNTVIFEGTYNTYKTWSVPSWVFNYPASKFTHLVYATSSSKNMKDAILTKSKNRNAGYVYVTNDVLPNPWDTLPSYWSTELSYINQGC
ncbi:MAG: spherulation-specific family 4 protein [Candidatus Woesearchaeota archaeon]